MGPFIKADETGKILFLSPRDDMETSKALDWKPPKFPFVTHLHFPLVIFPKIPTIYCASSNLKGHMIISDEVDIFFNFLIGRASSSYLQSSITCSLVWTMKS
jgi:hypothetical protein